MREHIYIYNNDHLHDLFGFLLFNNLFNIIIVCSLPELGLFVSLTFFPLNERAQKKKKNIIVVGGQINEREKININSMDGRTYGIKRKILIKKNSNVGQ